MTNLPPPPPSYPQGPYYGGPPPPPPVPAGKVRMRGRIPLRLALIFGVVGIGLAVAGIVVLFSSPLTKVDDFPRVPLDGTRHSVQLSRTGDYVGYFEAPGFDTSDDAPSGRLAITGPSGDVPITSYGPRTRLTYDLHGRHGIAIVTFRIDRAGEYSVGGRADSSAPGATLALGESIAHGLVAGIALFAPGLLLVIAAVVLLIVGLVKRSRHRRELRSAYVGGGGPNYYTGR